MRLGNAAWGLRETSLEKQLQITRSLGLDLLELGIGGHPNDFLQLDAVDSDIAQVKRLFNKYEIEILCASTGNDFTDADESARLNSLENVKKAIRIAYKLEIKYLRIFAGFAPVREVTGERWGQMIDMLNEALKHGQKYNVLPAIETHGGVEEYLDGIRHFDSTTTVKDKLVKLFNELKYPAGIVFDPANLGAVGMDEDEIISLYHKFCTEITYFHLKDFACTDLKALTPCACGEGQLCWQRIWHAIKSSPCPGLIEYEIPETIRPGIKLTLDNLKSYET